MPYLRNTHDQCREGMRKLQIVDDVETLAIGTANTFESGTVGICELIRHNTTLTELNLSGVGG